MRFSPDPTESNDVLIEEIRIVEANVMQETKYTGKLKGISSLLLFLIDNIYII